MELKKLYQLRDGLDEIIRIEEDKLKDKPYQSRMHESFQEALSKKMEKKYSEANELRETLGIEDIL